ncbi:hypothetical protein STRIP9103_00234 [Streptomyces ipomoeae 91-03]|uniref:Uncharacterized protein n=1 Tax=Streptomyces ipomoeae 91-03 TaxID=698759 RepID=L1KPM4_9ACTN|nr:hypothetical protein STRIP9103_00234 [Streptomyces ipomoeae 91-03]
MLFRAEFVEPGDEGADGRPMASIAGVRPAVPAGCGTCGAGRRTPAAPRPHGGVG